VPGAFEFVIKMRFDDAENRFERIGVFFFPEQMLDESKYFHREQEGFIVHQRMHWQFPPESACRLGPRRAFKKVVLPELLAPCTQTG
jgi:hypothetical protein